MLIAMILWNMVSTKSQQLSLCLNGGTDMQIDQPKTQYRGQDIHINKDQ